jgi:hypothetical protein
MSFVSRRWGHVRVLPVAAVLLATLVLSGMGYAVQESFGGQRSASGRELYTAPDGRKDGDGSRARPFDLATALSAAGPVVAGDTLWMRGGTYRGTFISDLRGTEAAPIEVRAVEGERVTIDGGSSNLTTPMLYVRGAWTTYRGFEVMSSDPLRTTTETGSQPASLRRGVGVDVHAPHTRLINLIVHDCADGLGIWSDAEEAEAYGNIIYHNGWSADDRAHGHGIYTQNKTGIRRITDNIIFDQFSHGIHAYGSDAATLDSIALVGNVVFNNGALDKRYYDRNILLGGGRVAANTVVENNYTYYTPTVRHGGENNIGYGAGCTNLTLRNNYFAGQWEGGAPIRLLPNCAGVVTGNMFYGPLEPWIGRAYPNNTYQIDRPTGIKVFVRRHQYDAGRATVVVYNWDKLPTLTLDLSEAKLDPRAAFELRDAQNIFGPPVASGVFRDGRVTVSLRNLTVAAPVGNVPTPVHTAPEFAVFVLVSNSKAGRLTAFAAGVSDVMQQAWRALSFTKS